jgi:hypothetical protein
LAPRSVPDRRVAYVGGLPLAVVIVTENDPLGECVRGACDPAWVAGVSRPPWACVQAMRHGVFICRRLGVEAGRRCGGRVAGSQERSLEFAVNPGWLLTILDEVDLRAG